MRVSDDRYSRDFRSFNLALRMLRFEARTHTIVAWTGISAERVRNLSKSHRRQQSARQTERHRGPSPSQLGLLLTNPGLRSELAALAGLLRVLGVIPDQPIANPRERLPSIINGERLCFALELFREVVPSARLSFEQAVLLVYALAEGTRWHLDHCTGCHALILMDQLSLHRRVCVHCQREDRERKRGNVLIEETVVEADAAEKAKIIQCDLFPEPVHVSSG
jgi:hypothetical protein